MKITTFFLLLGIMTVSASTIAQKITLNEKRIPLEQVLDKIRQQSGYDIVYNAELISTAAPVTINLKNVTIDEALKSSLEGQQLTYEIKDQTVLIKQKETSLLDKIKAAFTNIDVTGKVLDEQNLPVAGATIAVKGTNNATVAGADGSFTIRNVDDKAIIVITVIGYQKQELPAKTNLGNIRLVIAENKLDQVQVIAYGQSSQRLTTGNISSVSSKEIEEQPVTNVLDALEGRVPGLFITQTNGLNGGGVAVRIQGQNSITSGSEPLYVVDGVPIDSQPPAIGFENILGLSANSRSGPTFGSPLSYLNPSDIESITILKDADATSIYGSRGGNGVILINTKKGKAGATKVDFNLQNGWGTVPNRLDFLNTQQYLQIRNEALKNDGLIASANPTAAAPFKYSPDLTLWDTNQYTDWQKVLIGGTAQFTKLNTTVSGGNGSTQYLIGATYDKNGTVFPGNFDDQRGSVHFSVNNASTNNKFKVQLTGLYVVEQNKLPGVDLTTYIALAPNAPAPYNPDGTLNWAVNSKGASSWVNPFRYLAQTFQRNTNNLNANLVLSYNILPGLDLKSSFGYTNAQTNDLKITPLTWNTPEGVVANPNSRFSSFGTANSNSWIIEPTLNFRKDIHKGKLDILIGGTILERNVSTSSIQVSGQTSDLLLNDMQAGTSSIGAVNQAQYKYDAIFGRLNYILHDKYIVDMNIRRDGSSRFGPANEFHDFWSAGGAWIFSDEKFLKNNFPLLSFGKIKISYGTTGNDQISDYTFINSYYDVSGYAIPYQGQPGIGTYNLYNPYLQWEETHKLSVGFDLGFLSDRVLFNVNYARNQSSNLLLNQNIPSITGNTQILVNFPAKNKNKFLVASLVSETVYSEGLRRITKKEKTL